MQIALWAAEQLTTTQGGQTALCGGEKGTL